MWAEPTRDGTLAATVASWTRRTRFELVSRSPLRFPTYHPQGLAIVGGKLFLSTVEILEWPVSPPGAEGDPARRTPGRGQGHVLVMQPDGTLLADLLMGEGDAYHPGGIDHAAGFIWVPVAEYRANSRSILYTIDTETLEVIERFRVDEHISLLAADPEARMLFGASWGSRRFHQWTLNSQTKQPLDLAVWANPSHFVDFQDSQYDAGGRIICAGISEFPTADGGVFELGGLGVVDFTTQQLLSQVPMPAFSSAGHVATRNPFVLTCDAAGPLLHVAPDDGGQHGNTELLTYRVINSSGDSVSRP